MVAVSFALPQLLYRRTTGRWLLPLVPLLRVLALLAAPADAVLSLLPVADRSRRRAERPGGGAHAGREYRGADLRRHRRRPHRGRGSQAHPIRGGVRRQGGARSDDRRARTSSPISADATLEHLRQLVINEQYSRIPGVRGQHRPGDRLRPRARHVRTGRRRTRQPHRARPGAPDPLRAGDQAGERPACARCSRRAPTW